MHGMHPLQHHHLEVLDAGSPARKFHRIGIVGQVVDRREMAADLVGRLAQVFHFLLGAGHAVLEAVGEGVGLQRQLPDEPFDHAPLQPAAFGAEMDCDLVRFLAV